MLKKISIYELEIKLLTGMHIGGYEDSFDIGGADATVIKNPITRIPFIPGSTIKGKLRSLLTAKYGRIHENDIELDDDYIKNIFDAVEINKSAPCVTRALFRDFTMTDDSIHELETVLGKGVYTEIKAENSIDKLKGTAGNPRFIERVPAGVSFTGQIVLSIYDGDDEKNLKETIEDAISLLELNYIGGSGSRGYGRVQKVKGEWKDEWKNENI